MTLARLAWCGLTYHWRHHAAVLAGVCASSVVLIGALVVGDSVRASLRRLALARLGTVDHAVDAGERLLRPEVGAQLSRALGTPVASVLRLDGTAANADGRLSVGRVQVLGVDARFWSLDAAAEPELQEQRGVAVNRRLAALLGLTPGDDLVLRVGQAQSIPGDLPMMWGRPASRPARLTVDAVVEDAHLGRFSLAASQTPPATVFLSRAQAAALFGGEDRANLLLVASRPGAKLSSSGVGRALAGALALADVGLRLDSTMAGGRQLASDQFFLPPPAARAALEAYPDASGVLTYFVNRIASARGAAAYSFVAASPAAWAARAARDNEIVLTEWLAHDLSAAVGDAVELTYYAPETGARLAEATARLRVAAIVGTARAADATLVPELPGLTRADSCHSWDPSFPIDLSRVRPRDEEYWARYRAAPKAFVTLATAQRLWGNRHGDLTAVRFPPADGGAQQVARRVLDRLAPAALGIQVRSVREEGLRAAAGGLDLGGLFLGLSFFLIAAALLFAALFQALAVARRAGEGHTLATFGLSLAQIRRVVLLESVPVALLGTAIGVVLARGYAALVLRVAPAFAGGASSHASLAVSIEPATLAFGMGVHSAVSVLILLLASRRLAARRPAAAAPRTPVRELALVKASIAATGLTVAVAVALLGGADSRAAAIAAWAAGGLALACGILGLESLLDALGSRSFSSLPSLGLRGVARHRRRSLTIVSGLAAAVFIVALVALHGGSDRLGETARSSGTGGFAFMAETALPLRHDLNSAAGRRALGLPDDLPARVVAMRVREGDDASCRNLNRVANPRVLGVESAAFADRRAFSFADQMPGAASEISWRVLDQDSGDGTVPAVADASTIAWGLGKQLGDVITVTDGNGQPLRLRLAASLESSILQGSLVIGERQFLRHFPAATGFGVLLIDADPSVAQTASDALRQSLRDHGLDLRPATERLAELRAVEDTYVAIFLALGVLGLTLATAGCAAIVGRDVVERGRELAFLRALGFGRVAIMRMLLAEHGLLLAAGVVLGLLAAGIAFTPGAARLPSTSSLVVVALTLLAVPSSGMAAALLACRAFLQRELSEELRCE